MHISKDPYCAWSLQNKECEYHSVSEDDTSSLLQQINTGIHQGCPKGEYGKLFLSVSLAKDLFLEGHALKLFL